MLFFSIDANIGKKTALLRDRCAEAQLRDERPLRCEKSVQLAFDIASKLKNQQLKITTAHSVP